MGSSAFETRTADRARFCPPSDAPLIESSNPAAPISTISELPPYEMNG